MKKTFVIMSLLLSAGFARADCGSATEKQHACCKKATEASMHQGGKDCCAAQTGEAAGDMCSNLPKGDADKVRAAFDGKAKDIEMTGKLYCAACDLKTAEKCQHVFKSGETAYVVLATPESMKLSKIASHGSKAVKVKAKTADVDGKSYLQIVTYEEVPEKPAV